MAKRGYDVTVFEALHEIGGVLKYGIPEFRLPNKIVDVEIEGCARWVWKFMTNCIVGKTISYDDLHADGFKGIFAASGAGLPNFMNIPGENLVGVMSSNEYLTRVNLMDAANPDSDTPVLQGKKVAVIGGGNTAMDSVRTARRLGAERAMIVYRRSEEEMPARLEEVKHAKEEGVEFMTLHLWWPTNNTDLALNKGQNLRQREIIRICLLCRQRRYRETLALILYGDLDISVIDELPPGRKPVKTYAVGESMRKRIFAFLQKNVSAGMQAYVVCPLIEETETSDLQNAEMLAEKLQTIFPEFKIGLMHGKMKAKLKEEVMDEFVRGEINILVSTTVIEVGVNVPNANIMVIENAERFGLSQLHQLRGRVGRGNAQAFCILFAHGKNEVTKKRMETMCISNDGFYISEQDLKLRGPGDFFGTRQHGLPEMRIANLFEDRDILAMSQEAAKKIMVEDRHLESEKYSGLRKRAESIISDDIVMN